MPILGQDSGSARVGAEFGVGMTGEQPCTEGGRGATLIGMRVWFMAVSASCHLLRVKKSAKAWAKIDGSSWKSTAHPRSTGDVNLVSRQPTPQWVPRV